MANQWGYVDPVQRVHQQRAQRQSAHPMVQQPVQPYYSLETVQSPLANLPQAQAQIFYGNGFPAAPQRHHSVVVRMIVGAIVGGLIGSMLDRRRARKAQEAQDVRESLGVAHLFEDAQPAPTGKHHMPPAPLRHGPMSGH